MRRQLENVWEGRGTCLLPHFLWRHPRSHLLHGRQALELGAAEVLLLQGRRLQHEVLLLGCIHLLQVLGCCAGLPVQGLLDHLRRAGRGREEPLLQSGLLQPLPPNDQVCDPHSPGSRGDGCLHSSTRSHLIYLHLSSGYTLLFCPDTGGTCPSNNPQVRRQEICATGSYGRLVRYPPHHSAASDESNRPTGVMRTERDGKKERQAGSGGLFQPAKLKSVQGQHPPGRVCP